MANRNKTKGTAWESAVRDYLNKSLGLLNVHGTLVDPFSPLNVRRAAQEGARDVGDVHAVPFVLEAKDVARPAVPTFLRQARIEAKHAGFPYGVAVVKARGKSARDGRVHIDVRTWTRVRRELGMSARKFATLYGFTPSLRGLDTDRWYLTTTLERFVLVLADVRQARGQ